MDEITVIEQPSTLAIMSVDDIARANYDVLRRSGRKESTRQEQYKQTEDQWEVWCAANGLNPTNFEVVYIDAFFQSIKEQIQPNHPTKHAIAPAEFGRGDCGQF